MIDARKTEAMVKNLADNVTERHWTPEDRIRALTKLVEAMSTGLLLVQRHRAGEAEPYPGAIDSVIRTSLYGVEIARRSDLIPSKD